MPYTVVHNKKVTSCYGKGLLFLFGSICFFTDVIVFNIVYTNVIM